MSYLINSNIGRSIFESLAQGATRYNLSKANFNNVIINFPKDIREQQAIAQILSDMDGEIKALEQQLQKTQARHQDIFTNGKRLETTKRPLGKLRVSISIASVPKRGSTNN